MKQKKLPKVTQEGVNWIVQCPYKIYSGVQKSFHKENKQTNEKWWWGWQPAVLVQVASARGSSINLILKLLWLWVLTSLMAPSRTYTKASLCFILLRAFPGLGPLRGQFLLKAFKVKGIRHSNLEKGTTLGIRNRMRAMERKGLGKEIHGRIGIVKAPMYTGESGRPWTYTGQDTCSGKAQEDPKLSHSAGLQILCKQKLKAKAGL